METGTITVLDGFPILFEVDGEIVMPRQDIEYVPLDDFIAELKMDGWTVRGEMPPVTHKGRYTIPLVHG
jgi:hypothetical protein